MKVAHTVIRAIQNIVPKSNFITFSKLGTHGRLGNQLFQIAAVIGCAKTYRKNAKFPKWFCNYTKVYYSDFFKNKIDEALDRNQIKFNYKEPTFEYKSIPIFKEPVDLLGYFQSENYFKHCVSDILHYFEPADFLVKKIHDKYSNELTGNTCSIHVRRGDYTGSKVHDVCDLEYYNTCINNMISMNITKFLVFSDDINWCKSNFTNGDFHFIEGNSPVEDLFIMSFCKHNIIANSSFSWWASYLNKNPEKVVYAPKKWFNDASPIKEYESIYRKDMRRI